MIRALSFLSLAACGLQPLGTDPTEAEFAGDTAEVSLPLTVFDPRPDASEGLTNTSANLNEVLERGALRGACAAWEADPGNQRKKLLCGKSMFFYEGFDTIGIPAPLYDFTATRFPNELGVAYTKLGLIEDPYNRGRSLGVGPGAPLGTVETLALTCASCHFGQLPDGRYSVGAPNLQYEYGEHMLSLFLVPMAAAPNFNSQAHHPDAIARIQPVLEKVQGSMIMKMTLLIELLPLLTEMNAVSQMDYETEGHYAHWGSGTMDFVIAPLPLDDGVHTISKIQPLWRIPSREEELAGGMPHAMLAWTGAGESVEQFLAGFVRIGGGNEARWTEERLSPLAEYIRSLDPPTPPPQDPDQVAAGEQVFIDACLDCHNGPGGSGTRIFSFEEVGTDDAMARWGDPDEDGMGCCGLTEPGDPALTGGIKAPRLWGTWAFDRLLHTGSVTSLESLLCLEPRPEWPSPFGAQGHEFGCDLSEEDREAILAFVRSH